MISVILCFSVVADGCNCSACKQDVLFFLLAPNLYTNSSSNPVLSFLQVVLRWGTFILSKATRKLWSTSSEGPRTWSSCLIKGRTSFLKCKEVLQSLHSCRVFIYRLWFIYERIFHAVGSVTRVQIELQSCSWGGLVVLSNCLLFEGIKLSGFLLDYQGTSEGHSTQLSPPRSLIQCHLPICYFFSFSIPPLLTERFLW